MHRVLLIAFRILQVDYCPPLDPSLFQAIAADYDLSDPTDVAQLKQTLDQIRNDAEFEQQTDFDPSGASGLGDTPDSTVSAELASLNEDSGVTSITDSIPSVKLGTHSASPIPDGYDEGIEELPIDEKMALLVEMCPEIKRFDIESTLKKARGNFGKALDELLNQVWLQNNTKTTKGVDGFFNSSRQPKRKNKKKAKVNLSSFAEPENYDPVPKQNAWDVKKKEIDFIASRVNLPESLVNGIYRTSGALMNAAILELCKVDASSITKIPPTEPIIQMNALQLNTDFPNLSSSNCLALILLTHPSTSNAHELAKAIVSPSARGDTAERSFSSYIVPQYARPKIEADKRTDEGRSESLTDMSLHLDHATLTTTAAKYANVRQLRFEQATAAWRKAKSNPLMGGAAHYYAEERRKADVASRAYSSAAADALVMKTSTAASVDLHGVNVPDAVRIAKTSVQAWWNSGKAEWSREGRIMGGDGFTIITGAGSHSKDGKAKIRPAVLKALKDDGWRIDEDVSRSEVIVMGKVRK
jgi:hypothetical protein